MEATLLEKTPMIIGFIRIKAAMMAEYKGDAIKPVVNMMFSLTTLVLNFAHSPTPRTAACFFPNNLLNRK
jgi:hypothetical protein